jgi:hypothetical protein
MKYIFLKTSSVEKFNEIRPHFLKYNIECLNEETLSQPFAVLREHSEISKGVVTSTLLVEQYIDPWEKKDRYQDEEILEIKKVYTHKAKGFLINETNKDAWGYDAQFVPDGLMRSYYELKQDGIKISPRDINIDNFIIDFCFVGVKNWSFKKLDVKRSIDLEADFGDILYDFFDLNKQKRFKQYGFWKKVVDSAVSGGVFLRASTPDKKLNNYWWPVGNAGLPVTKKSKDPMHEKTYLMHDIFHFLVPDLLYTPITNISDPNFEWVYVLHRVMTECFTLVLGDMFYVHYNIINNVPYKTVNKRRIYPIFEKIFGSRDDVFTKEIISEVVRASCDYGINGSDKGFMDLYTKYNTFRSENSISCVKPPHEEKEFKRLLLEFRDKYDYYLIQDLNWTEGNSKYMKKHRHKYKYLSCFSDITEKMNIVTMGSIKITNDLDYYVDLGLNQLFDSMETTKNFGPLKNKFFRYALGQMCFFEHYNKIPLLVGYKIEFTKLIKSVVEIERECDIINKVQYFRYSWDNLMDLCFTMSILTDQERDQYKEVYPIFDPNYITSYDDKKHNHTEVMKNFLKEFDTTRVI